MMRVYFVNRLFNFISSSVDDVTQLFAMIVLKLDSELLDVAQVDSDSLFANQSTRIV